MTHIEIANHIISDIYTHFHDKNKVVRDIQLESHEKGVKGNVFVTMYFEDDDEWDCSDPYSCIIESDKHLDSEFITELNTIMRFALHGESTPYGNPHMITKIEKNGEGYHVVMKRHRNDTRISFYDDDVVQYIEPYMTKEQRYYGKYVLLQKAIAQGEDLKEMWKHIIGKEHAKLKDLERVETNGTIDNLIKECKRHIAWQKEHLTKLESYYELKKEMEQNMREKTEKELVELAIHTRIEFL